MVVFVRDTHRKRRQGSGFRRMRRDRCRLDSCDLKPNAAPAKLCCGDEVRVDHRPCVAIGSPGEHELQTMAAKGDVSGASQPPNQILVDAPWQRAPTADAIKGNTRYEQCATSEETRLTKDSTTASTNHEILLLEQHKLRRLADNRRAGQDVE